MAPVASQENFHRTSSALVYLAWFDMWDTIRFYAPKEK